jgi:hypothetical protein
MQDDPFKLAIIGVGTFFITLFLIWALGFGGPIIYPKVVPFQPSSEAPVWDPNGKHTSDAETKENPKLAKLRAAVVDAYSKLNVSPCDKKAKEEFIDTLMEVVGEINSGHYYEGPKEASLNKPMVDAFADSIRKGYIVKDDLPNPHSRDTQMLFNMGLTASVQDKTDIPPKEKMATGDDYLASYRRNPYDCSKN